MTCFSTETRQKTKNLKPPKFFQAQKITFKAQVKKKNSKRENYSKDSKLKRIKKIKNKMTHHNDIVVLHVLFKGDRYITARILEMFIREQVAESNTTKTVNCHSLKFSFAQTQKRQIAWLFYDSATPECIQVSQPSSMVYSKKGHLKISLSNNSRFRHIISKIKWPELIPSFSPGNSKKKQNKNPTSNPQTIMITNIVWLL